MSDNNHPLVDVDPPAGATPATTSSRSLGAALTVISMAQLLIILDGTIANIALPHIAADLKMSDATVTWIITGYALVFGAFLLLGGRLGDRYGYRRVFSIGLLVVASASALAGLATNPSAMLAGRVIHGLGGALAAPAALALISTTFPAGQARTRAYGFYAAMSGVGSGVGLILGGWLTSVDSVFGAQVGGWRLAFLINVPIAVLAMLLAPRTLIESERQPLRLDVWGAVTSVSALVGLVYAFTRAGEIDAGWTDPWTILSFAAGTLLLAAFVVIEHRSNHPLLPLRIFRDRDRAVSLVAMFLSFGGMFSIFYFLTVSLQRVLGYPPLQAGLAFLPFALGVIVGASLATRMLQRLDPRHVAAAAMLLSAVSLFMLSQLSVHSDPDVVARKFLETGFAGQSINYWTAIFPYLLTVAAGFGAIVAALTPPAVHGVRSDDRGAASGALNTVQQIGGALGLAILATVALRGDRAEGGLDAPLRDALAGHDEQLREAASQIAFLDGATHALFIVSIVLLITSVVTATFLRTRRHELNNSDASSAPSPS